MIWGAFLKKYWVNVTPPAQKKFVAACSYLLILSVIDNDVFC